MIEYSSWDTATRRKYNRASPRALAQIRLESARRASGATQAGRGRYVRFARGHVLKQRVAPSKRATSEARAARARFQ